MLLKKKKSSLLPGFIQNFSAWLTKSLNIYSSNKFVLVTLFVAGISIYSTLLIFAGGYLQSIGFHYKVLKPLILETKDTAIKYYKTLFTEFDHFDIDIKHKDFMKLEYTRDLSIKNGTLVGITNDYVDAKIRHNGETIPVKLRLRGSTAHQHHKPEKWSMRIKVKGDGAVMRMKMFSLMDPFRRNLMLEWFQREVLRKEGVVSKRYEFVDISINGTWKGIYALDEYYDKTMLEYNHRKEGPILRFAQEPIFVEKPQGPVSSWNELFDKMDIDALNSNKLFKNEDKFKQFQHAANLLQAFRSGEMKTHEVFDIDKLAKWMAIGDLLGGWHGFTPNNMKFYYNPIISRLEPVPDDHFNERRTDPGPRLLRLEDKQFTGKFVKTMFADLEFARQYARELERVSKKEYLDDLFEFFSEKLERTLNILHTDRTLIWYNFPKEQLYINQDRVRRALNPYKAIQAFIENISSSHTTISIANNERMPIEILNVVYQGEKLFPLVKNRGLVIRGKKTAMPGRFLEYKFSSPKNKIPENISPLDWTVSYRFLGNTKTHQTNVFTYPAYRKELTTTGIPRKKPDLNKFKFLSIDSDKKEISFTRGHWKLNQDLLIPKDFKVVIGQGMVLDLVNSAKILSYSPIEITGTEEHPVLITSSDATGQGITVINALEESIFRYVIFNNLSPPSHEDWELTGSINFYESPVQLHKSKFIGNVKGDDFLNIVRSNFIIKDNSFKNTFADALDIDFSSGKIENTSFQDCGMSGQDGDGLDLSGSSVNIENVIFENIGDKALSIGENSAFIGENIEIKNSRIAVASKDLSSTKINTISINDSKIGFAVFQKKPEYGPSNLQIANLKTENIENPYLIENNSEIFIDGKKINSNSQKVKEFLYEKK